MNVTIRRAASRATAAAAVAMAALTLLVAACSAGAGASPPATSTGVAAPSASESMMEHASATPGAAMTDGTGAFHGVDGTASGTAALIHLASGGFTVTFEGFGIAATDHLHVLLVSNHDVTASSQVDLKASLDLGMLTGTSGMLDFALPAGIAPTAAMGYHTVVIWDTVMGHVVAAAPLAAQP